MPQCTRQEKELRKNFACRLTGTRGRWRPPPEWKGFPCERPAAREPMPITGPRNSDKRQQMGCLRMLMLARHDAPGYKNCAAASECVVRAVVCVDGEHRPAAGDQPEIHRLKDRDVIADDAPVASDGCVSARLCPRGEPGRSTESWFWEGVCGRGV